MSSPEDRPRRPRLADVAQAAGVSLGAASKALSAPDAVRPRTLAAVQAAVEQLGYIPSEAGRMLASRRTRMIGVVLPSLYHPVYAAYFHGLQARLARHDYLTVALSYDFEKTVEKSLIERLVRKGVDALVLADARQHPETIALLERTGIPHIFSWAGEDETPPAQAVGFSDGMGMRDVVRHLAALGHRRIAMLNGDPLANARGHWRRRGVEDAAAELGMDLVDIITVPLTIQGGQQGLRRIMTATGAGITALICSTDLVAAGVLHAARMAGIDVPGQLSVTGFDDIEMAELLSPALTTVRVPVDALSSTTADRIVAMVEGAPPTASILFPTQLIVRASTAAPAGTPR